MKEMLTKSKRKMKIPEVSSSRIGDLTDESKLDNLWGSLVHSRKIVIKRELKTNWKFNSLFKESHDPVSSGASSTGRGVCYL